MHPVYWWGTMSEQTNKSTKGASPIFLIGIWNYPIQNYHKNEGMYPITSPYPIPYQNHIPAWVLTNKELDILVHLFKSQESSDQKLQWPQGNTIVRCIYAPKWII